MFTQIKTSKANKEYIAQLTRKFNLGTENFIARIAFAYSLSLDRQLNLNEIKDSGGKEYSKTVLFGDYFDLYIGILCVNYGMYKTDKDLPKYIKLHIDDGIELLFEEFNKSNLEGFDFLVQKIENGLLTIDNE
ncbi:DndE family protein [Flavobacterium sp.]|uniref:DndE family protein n=1 Tax=Flavobacterium sp. TaxID=239 RepID=UPI00391ABA3D